jgi:hypothetical protein
LDFGVWLRGKAVDRLIGGDRILLGLSNRGQGLVKNLVCKIRCHGISRAFFWH